VVKDIPNHLIVAEHDRVEELKQRGDDGGGIPKHKNSHWAAFTERPTVDSAAESRSKLTTRLCFVLIRI